MKDCNMALVLPWGRLPKIVVNFCQSIVYIEVENGLKTENIGRGFKELALDLIIGSIVILLCFPKPDKR